MPQENPREFAWAFLASDELDKQAGRTGIPRDVLEKQAEIMAALTAEPEEDLLQPEHVVQAAEQLSRMLAELKEQRADRAAVFLSYATKDEDFARELEDDLRKEGVTCFLAPLSIKPGAIWPEEIWQAIRGCRVFVLVGTADALKSKWCLLEIGAALGLKKPILAILRHSAKLPDVLKHVQALKVQTKKQQVELMAQIKKLLTS